MYRDIAKMGKNTGNSEEIAQDRIGWKKIFASCKLKRSPNAGGNRTHDDLLVLQ